MTENNPYATPVSDLATSLENDFALQTPRSVGVGQGINWIGEGFGYFKNAAGQWILTCIVGFVIMLVLNLIPIINMFAGLFFYVWLGGLILGLKAQHDGEEFNINYLFAGFKKNTGQLVLLALLLGVISLAIMVVLFGSLFWQIMSGTYPGTDVGQASSFLLNFLIAMALLLPVYMAFWFAPHLIVLHDQSILDALKLSFSACLKNFLPFLLYGIVAFLLLIIAMIPFGLGLLVVFPALMASMFVAYKDIFVTQDDE